MLSTVQSVTGPVGPEALGITLPHEHVFINMSPTEPRDGYMTVWEERKADIERFLAAGGRTILDVTNAELSNHAAPVYFDADPEHQVQNPVTGSRSVANVLATKAHGGGDRGDGDPRHRPLLRALPRRRLVRAHVDGADRALPRRRSRGGDPRHRRPGRVRRRGRLRPPVHHRARGALVPRLGPRGRADGRHGHDPRADVPDRGHADRHPHRGGRRSLADRRRPHRHREGPAVLDRPARARRLRRVRLHDGREERRRDRRARADAARRLPQGARRPGARRAHPPVPGRQPAVAPVGARRAGPHVHLRGVRRRGGRRRDRRARSSSSCGRRTRAACSSVRPRRAPRSAASRGRPRPRRRAAPPGRSSAAPRARRRPGAGRWR